MGELEVVLRGEMDASLRKIKHDLYTGYRAKIVILEAKFMSRVQSKIDALEAKIERKLEDIDQDKQDVKPEIKAETVDQPVAPVLLFNLEVVLSQFSSSSF